MVVLVIVMGVEGSVCVVMVVVVMMSLAKENNHPEIVRVLEQVSE